jgi:hypothetical protein
MERLTPPPPCLGPLPVPWSPPWALPLPWWCGAQLQGQQQREPPPPFFWVQWSSDPLFGPSATGGLLVNVSSSNSLTFYLATLTGLNPTMVYYTRVMAGNAVGFSLPTLATPSQSVNAIYSVAVVDNEALGGRTPVSAWSWRLSLSLAGTPYAFDSALHTTPIPHDAPSSTLSAALNALPARVQCGQEGCPLRRGWHPGLPRQCWWPGVHHSPQERQWQCLDPLTLPHGGTTATVTRLRAGNGAVFSLLDAFVLSTAWVTVTALCMGFIPAWGEDVHFSSFPPLRMCWPVWRVIRRWECPG